MNNQRSKELNDLLENKQSFVQRWAEIIILLISGLLLLLAAYLQINYHLFK
jgi:hypothetical protein